jgi:hypothetical protein
MSYSVNMTISPLKVIQNLGKRQPSHATAHHHLMLTGIRQTMLLQNWGKPEFHICLKRLRSFSRQKTLYLIVNSDDEADYSILIYRKKDRILFFTKKRLILHFKWSGFEEKYNELKGGVDVNSIRISPPLIAKTLALVA